MLAPQAIRAGDATLSVTRGTAHMRRDTIFRVSSMTKPIAAAAAMVLVQDGVLELDAPVDAWLPELADRRVLKRLDGPLGDTVPARRPITLRDLLTFRMGFGQLIASEDDYPILKAAIDLDIGMGAPSPSKTPEPDEWMRRLASLPLMAQPGETWLYNTGSDVLGVLIARASGAPLENVLQKTIFAPLGMTDTRFSVVPSDIGRLATSYMPNPKTGALDTYDEAEGGQWSRPPACPSAGGGLVSTADDYLAFVRMLRNGDDGILSEASVAEMTRDHLTADQRGSPILGANSGWGFGMAVTTIDDDFAGRAGSYGWDGGLGSSWRTDPTEDLTTVFLSQSGWSSPSAADAYVDFRKLAYAAIEG